MADDWMAGIYACLLLGGVAWLRFDRRAGRFWLSRLAADTVIAVGDRIGGGEFRS